MSAHRRRSPCCIDEARRYLAEHGESEKLRDAVRRYIVVVTQYGTRISGVSLAGVTQAEVDAAYEAMLEALTA